MKVKMILTMAAAALIMAACSSDEIESVALKGNGMMPLEIVTDVANQTRAAQITASNIDAFTVDVTGTFKTATGANVVNPVLSVTRSGAQWTYIYNGDNYGPLYWPAEIQTTTFSAHTAANGASIDEKDSQTDIVGDFQTVIFDGTTATSTVALTMRHAVAKMEFKARVQEPLTEGTDVSIDIKQVAVRNMKYAGIYARPTAESTFGVITATDASGNLFTETRSETSFLTKNDDDAATIGSLFMVPQTDIAASAFATPAAPGAYLSVLAQIRVIQGEQTTVTFPEAGSTSSAAASKYAWIAVPLPAEFTAMQAHKKYVFTLNFSTDALGNIDIVQDAPSTVTPKPDEFEPIVLKGRSGNGVSVTVETINDFDEDVMVDINKPLISIRQATNDDLGKLICTDGHIHAYGENANCTANRVAKIIYVGSSTYDATYTHGLALALADESKSAWEDAKTACSNKNTSLAVTGASWMLPSKEQWETMGAIHETSTYVDLRDSFESVGGSNMQKDAYWSSTVYSTDFAWIYYFEDKVDNDRPWENAAGIWGQGQKSYSDIQVRACLAF